MSYWLLLADPETYGFDQLEKDGKTIWDGIAGSLAQKHLRSVQKGDRALIYHTAPDKSVIGSARVLSNSYPDPKDVTGKLVVVDVQAERRFPKPVSLASLRENQKLAGMTFLKIQRIAVSPVGEAEFSEILRMGGL